MDRPSSRPAQSTNIHLTILDLEIGHLSPDQLMAPDSSIDLLKGLLSRAKLSFHNTIESISTNIISEVVRSQQSNSIILMQKPQHHASVILSPNLPKIRGRYSLDISYQRTSTNLPAIPSVYRSLFPSSNSSLISLDHQQ